MQVLTGVLPILPTVFDARGHVDEPGMRRVLDYVIDAGASGLVFPGLASEAESLTHDERLQLTAKLGEWINGRVPFVVGASSASLDDASAYAEAGARAGAVAAMVLTPRALAGDVAALADFYATIARHSGLALMLQNAPAPMGVGLPLEQVAELARAVPAIRYVKEEAPPSGQRITQLTQLAGDALDAVYGGAGARHVMDEWARGAQGTMPACEISEVHVAMDQHYRAGRHAAAWQLYERSLPLLTMQAVFRWRLTKAVLLRRGLIQSDFTRAAGPALDVQDHAELDRMLGRLHDLLPALKSA